ncbi:MAG: 3-oxoacyl-[acyl-carrier protein] reductase [Neolewinella sp.]|jgi:3-oxoacyl-[acyl-carrier protein] reductase
MDLQLSKKTFCVGGATSGLGRAVAERLLAEGAQVIGVARGRDKLDAMAAELGKAFTPYAADLTDGTAVRVLGEYLVEQKIDGCVLNAGGPRTGRVEELSMEDWDQAYHGTLRWKIQLINALLPILKANGAGRLLFLESVSIKQPIDNLVLSNAMRAAVAGYVKTLSREVGADGLTINILAPGYHATPRITTVLEKSAEIQGISLAETEAGFTAETSVKKLGDPADFAGMAAFLLSPMANYITGQTITVDGGLVRHITG